MLGCSGDPDGKFEGWTDVEHRILSDPSSQRNRSFLARIEVRTGLANLLETTCNMVVGVRRAAKSDALRH